MFFAFVLDALSRMVVGWQLAQNMRTTLVLDTSDGPRPTCSRGRRRARAHSDRGGQGGLNRSSQQRFCVMNLRMQVTARWASAQRRDGVARLSSWRLVRRASRSGDSRVRASGYPARSGPDREFVTASGRIERVLVSSARRARWGPVQTVVVGHSFQHFARASPAKRFPGRRFQRLCDGSEILSTVHGQVDPFGKYWRSGRSVFSLVPCCHGLGGSQK